MASTAPAPSLSSVTAYELKLAWPLGAFFLLFFVAPLVLLFVISLHTDTSMTRMGLTQYLKFLLDPFSLKVLAGTLWLGIEVTLLCLVLGFPLAYIYLRVPGWFQGVLMLFVLLP